MNRRARGGGNSKCRWAGILIVADHPQSDIPFHSCRFDRLRQPEASSFRGEKVVPVIATEGQLVRMPWLVVGPALGALNSWKDAIRDSRAEAPRLASGHPSYQRRSCRGTKTLPRPPFELTLHLVRTRSHQGTASFRAEDAVGNGFRIDYHMGRISIGYH